MKQFSGMVCKAACVLLLTGCSFSGTIAEHAIEYNKTIEQVENEILLLNVIRASENRTTHFSRVTEISGALESSFSNVLTAPFGRNTADAFSNALTLGGASKPTYAVQSLNSQEFYNGFLKPIDSKTFSLLLGNGWPLDTLLNALVEQVDIYVEETSLTGPPTFGPDQMPVGNFAETCRIISNPDGTYAEGENRPKYEQQEMFHFVVGLLKNSRDTFHPGKVNTFGPPLPTASVSDIAAIAKLREAGFGLDGLVDPGNPGNVQIQLTRAIQSTQFRANGIEKDDPFLERAKAAFDAPSGGFCGAKKNEAKIDLIKLHGHDKRNNNSATDETLKFSAKLTLRSAQGMFYAYGEMVSFFRDIGKAGELDTGKLGFFKLKSGEAAPEGTVSTVYNGKAYWIPMGKDGNDTRRLLALAHQIFSLNISAKDAPTTQTIRFIQ